MKNLKKVLSLVLALAMALSLMTVAFAADAKDYADYGEVNYNEAVDVMTAVGVFDGMNGSFNPDGTLTREQAAKIITYMLMGKSDADKLTTTIAPYSDVSASRWSAGAIAYCTNEGIISGMGHNKFAPSDPVTGLQFAKMLLVALGYDAEIENLVGDSWAINTSKLAISVGLDDNMEEVSLSQPLTREQATLMAFNAMQSPLVEYPSKGTTIEVNGATVSFGAQQAQYVTSTRANEQTISSERLSNTKDYTIEFAERYCRDLTLRADRDAFERPAHTWRYDNELIGTYQNTPDLTYTSTVEDGDIYADLGLTKTVKATEQYVDGKDVTLQSLVRRGETDITGSGNGVLTEVWYEEDDNGDVVSLIITSVNTYVATVGSVNKASSSVDRYITLATTTNDPDGTLNNRFETEDFAREDLVTYTAAWNDSTKRFDIQSVELLDGAVTGILNRWVGDANVDSSANFTVAGTEYDYSKNFAVDASGNKIATNFTVDESEMVVYLDEYGYALYIAGVESAKNYAVVIGVGDTNPYGSRTDGATLLLPDGTIKEVKYKMASGSSLTTPSSNNVREEIGDMVTYTVKDDVYTLTLVDGWQNSNATSTTFTNGKSAMALNTTPRAGGTDAVETKYTTSETVFFVATDDENGEKVYNVYTGYAAMPSLDSSKVEGVAVALSDNRTQVEAVYVSATQLKGIEGVDTFVSFEKDWKVVTDNTGSYYVLPAVVEGNVTEVKLDYTYFSASGKINNVSGIYALDNVIEDSDGIITSASVKSVDTYNASPNWGNKVGIVAADGVVVGINTTSSARSSIDSLKKYAQYWAYTDATEVYYVSADHKVITDIGVNGINTDLNDVVFYSVDDDTKTLETVIIYEVEDGTPAPTPTGYKVEWTNPGVTMDGSTVNLANTSNMWVADSTGYVAANNVVVSYEISSWDTSTGKWNPSDIVYSAEKDLAAGSSLQVAGLGANYVAGTGRYQVTVTVTCDEVTKTFAPVIFDL